MKKNLNIIMHGRGSSCSRCAERGNLEVDCKKKTANDKAEMTEETIEAETKEGEKEKEK